MINDLKPSDSHLTPTSAAAGQIPQASLARRRVRHRTGTAPRIPDAGRADCVQALLTAGYQRIPGPCSCEVDPGALAAQYAAHALPGNWWALDYETFLAKRRTLMAAVIRKAFETL